MTEPAKANKLLWMDMEMTGLDEKRDHILEVAAIVTDFDLNVLDEYHAVVRASEDILALMDDWCVKTHGKSGLTEASKAGTLLETVEEELMALTHKHFPESRAVLCGNSVGQDRRFIDAYMKKFSSLLHYRIIDVSSFKEIFENKFDIRMTKKESHRARDDIFESIRELKHYLSFVQPKSPPGL